MKIELEYIPEGLMNLLDGLNNAIIVINDIYISLELGCEVPKKFKPFEKLSLDEIIEMRQKRMNSLNSLYQTLLKYE